MSNGQVCASLVPTGRPVRVRWDQGVISQLEPASAEEAGALWIAPALVDLQVNGYAGVDFQQNTVSGPDLLQAVAGLRAAGCTRILLTLITDDWDATLAHLHRLRTLRAASPELMSVIAGWHLEGPFLSAEPGFCGAHNPDLMRDPSPECIRQLREAAGRDQVLLTLAPERAGALEAIALAVSAGIQVSLGHTNAPAGILERAVAAGARGFTHFGNACPQKLDRHDNILWRVLDTSGLTMGLIADGIHVSAPLFRLAHRVLPNSALYYTTDAVAPAGAPPGRYSVGKLEVEVGPDQVVRQPGRTNYAGSALRPIEGIWRAATMLHRPWQNVWPSFSTNPAQFMSWQRSIAVGQPADFCILREADNGCPVVEQCVTRISPKLLKAVQLTPGA